MAGHRNDPFAAAKSTAAVEIGRILEDEVGRQCGRDRVAITGQATAPAVVGPFGECLLDTLARSSSPLRPVFRLRSWERPGSHAHHVAARAASDRLEPLDSAQDQRPCAIPPQPLPPRSGAIIAREMRVGPIGARLE